MVVGESLLNEVTVEAVPRGDEGEAAAVGGCPFQAGQQDRASEWGVIPAYLRNRKSLTKHLRSSFSSSASPWLVGRNK